MTSRIWRVGRRVAPGMTLDLDGTLVLILGDVKANVGWNAPAASRFSWAECRVCLHLSLRLTVQAEAADHRIKRLRKRVARLPRAYDHYWSALTTTLVSVPALRSGKNLSGCVCQLWKMKSSGDTCGSVAIKW